MKISLWGIICILLLPVCAYGETDKLETNWYSGFSVLLGFSYRNIYYEVNNTTTHSRGELSEEGERLPIAYFSSPYVYFKDTFLAEGGIRFGWYVNASYSFFDVNRQIVRNADGTETFIDNGTSIKGRLYYVLPTVFVNFGKKSQAKFQGVSGKLGYGWGLAHVSASGNILLGGQEGEIYEVDVNRFSFVSGYLAELRINSFAFRAIAVWPMLSDGGI